MKTLKYKTNINCGGCVATVTPYIEQVKGVRNWKVATDSKEKTLVVEGESVKSEEVENAVREAGFTIERVKKGMFW